MSTSVSQVRSRRGLIVWVMLSVAGLGAGAAALATRTSSAGSASSLSSHDRLALAREAFSRQNFARAEELLESYLKDGVGTVEERLFHARVLLELGRLSGAKEVLDSLHKEQPNASEVVLALGECHERAGERDLAVACFKRACDMNKSDARGFRLLGFAQEEQGDRMAALFSFRQSLRLQPGQEDLSRRMNEIGTSHQARLDPAGMRHNRSRDPFDDFDPRPPDPLDMLPQSGGPDPFQGLPRPGARTR